MLKLKEIVKTILVFVVTMLLICFAVSTYKVIINEIELKELIGKTGLYFLYTVGYGALEGDAILQNILAMIGIVSLALMSTFLTINLFWRLDDVTLNKKVICDNDILKFEFKNKGNTICDIKCNFMIYNEFTSENIEEAKEYYMPMLLKNSHWNLKVNLNETFWYRAIYYLLTTKNIKLYCIYSFVDTKNGQNSIKVEEITAQNIITDNKMLEYVEFIKPTILSCGKLLAVENGGKIDLTYSENMMNIHYEFKNNENKSNFVMAYYNFHNNLLNLEKYNKENTYLEFSAVSNKKLNLNVEIKSNSSESKKFIELTEEAKTIKIPLKEIECNLEQIREICFTIFVGDNELKNSLQISDLRIVTK